MITHHPDTNMLTEYASGSLATALGLIVCAHVQQCPQCRAKVEQLNQLGAAILNQSLAETVAPQSFTQLMARIRSHHPNENSNESSSDNTRDHRSDKPALSHEQQYRSAQDLSIAKDPLLQHLPKVVQKILPRDGKLKWQRASAALQTARLTTGQQDYEVAFQRISSGGKVVQHDHRGLEVTLVLCGSFSDEDGIYNAGDFLVRNPGEVHRPTATQHQDCLCLSVVAAPVRVTGLLGKFINPWLSFRPA